MTDNQYKRYKGGHISADIAMALRQIAQDNDRPERYYMEILLRESLRERGYL